jgi:hypothetical protein
MWKYGIIKRRINKKCMDESLRSLERRARAGGLVDWARFVGASARANEEQAIASLREVHRGDLVRVLQMSGSIGAALEVMNVMEQQVDSALRDAIWREGDAPLPPREAVLQSVLQNLTPERVQEIRKFHVVKLVIVPIASVDRYTEALHGASQTMEGSREPIVRTILLNNQTTQAQVEGSKITKWRFAITEGSQTFDVPEWDDISKTFQQRIGFFRNSNLKKKVKGPGSKGMSILDYPSYIALMYQGLLHGKPIDCEYRNDSKDRNSKARAWQYSLLYQEENGFLVGAASWRHDLRYVYLDDEYIGNRSVNARLRSAVMGDI